MTEESARIVRVEMLPQKGMGTGLYAHYAPMGYRIKFTRYVQTIPVCGNCAFLRHHSNHSSSVRYESDMEHLVSSDSVAAGEDDFCIRMSGLKDGAASAAMYPKPPEGHAWLWLLRKLY